MNAFVTFDNKPICLVCNQLVSKRKEFNVKRHFISKHSVKYDNYQNEFRQDYSERINKSSLCTAIGFLKAFFAVGVSCISELFETEIIAKIEAILRWRIRKGLHCLGC